MATVKNVESTAVSNSSRGANVEVLYALKKNAKFVKVTLEKNGIINKDYRIAATDASTVKLDDDSSSSSVELDFLVRDCIAIPLLTKMKREAESLNEIDGTIVATGVQFCPYSTSMLGNNNRLVPIVLSSKTGEIINVCDGDTKLTRIQRALLNAFILQNDEGSDDMNRYVEGITQSILSFDVVLIPKKLELIGDDKTLVIPRNAISTENDKFKLFLTTYASKDSNNEYDNTMKEIWKQLANIHGSKRVVRRGDINPDSSIRESGHRLLWPISGMPEDTGPGSAGWITVTEQNIKQSFDLTRVMFSRGNISEKIRFGKKLVQEGDMILDMYSGIGYYTLPAIVHGKAKHVFACEWNEHAAIALRYNLKSNGVQDKATVFLGDCRVIARTENLVDKFDRVSLGLLPSSEGGWRTAIRAVRNDIGGVCHIHGNVPDLERDQWTLWLCHSLLSILKEEKYACSGTTARNVEKRISNDEWVVLCTHVERVKSYAPMIHHYVADVFVGPFNSSRFPRIAGDMDSHRAGMIKVENGSSTFIPCTTTIKPPSCALSSDGVLNQKWMM